MSAIQSNALRHIERLGAITIISVAALFAFELFDFFFISIYEIKFIPSEDIILFGHLKRLLTITIFFIFSTTQFHLLTRKYPALTTKRNQRILRILWVALFSLLLFIIIRMILLLSLDFPHKQYSSLTDYLGSSIRYTAIYEVENKKNLYADSIVVSRDLANILLANQREITKEIGYCVYGYKLVPNTGSSSVVQGHIMVVDGMRVADILESTESLLVSEECPQSVQLSSLYVNDQSTELVTVNDYQRTTSNLIGFIHHHPQKKKDSLFQLYPSECHMSEQDIFSFAKDYLSTKAHVWGIVCGNQKIFFYSVYNITEPIDLIVTNN